MTAFQELSARAPLVLVGAGKMGGALLKGWLDRGLDAKSVIVIDPAPPEDARALLREAGITAATMPPAKLTARVIVVAVKPQIIAAVLPPLRPLVGPRTVVVSIAAGTTLARLAAGIGEAAIVRAMPNTPAQVGRGITGAVANSAADAAARQLADDLLAAVGEVVWVGEEGAIDAVTAVSGSGPAYVFLLVEALAEAGVDAGLSRETAERLARATVIGSGELLRVSPLPAAELRRNVTSPNGTTAAALAVLMGPGGLEALMKRAVAAAKRRSEELSG
jgi:pyrroline-5-carboxylate reductase